MQLEAGGMVLHVYVGHGLPSNTKPSIQCFGPATSQRKYRQTSDRQAHRTAPQPRSQRTEYAIVPIALTHSSTNRVYPCDAIEQNKRVNQNYTQPFRTESLDNQLKRNPRPKPPLKPKPKRYVEALYQYDAQDTDELSMEVGDCIELLNKDASGWWQGRVGNRVGLFPGNYVKEL
ncbi:hypothetical protein AB6A40_007926 [Gnathostoma spinigerum]|uniref:SH3 domain-containing protein n=1 Tax=Gnathostoma spinigerum TaxID=75299 RepID=A0ABD6EXA9_9BILA